MESMFSDSAEKPSQPADKSEMVSNESNPTVPHITDNSQSDSYAENDKPADCQESSAGKDTAEPPGTASASGGSVDTDNCKDKTEQEAQNVELKIPQEHARLDALLAQIPKKAQHGLLMQCDLILTCIDADSNYIALGTNIGLTFLYNRKDQSMQRLKSEISGDVITCVKLHHGIDHQLATGMASGTLCIFLIPGFVSLHKKQLQKFEVKLVHRHYVTCVEWSTNGMKLYSGDKTGHVVCTEVDFYQGQCKSSELLVEPPTEVVQLHYDHKVLLVSTKVRSFVCRLDTTCEIMQIGHQERKLQGNFGACFIPGLCKTADAKLYTVRPGCRVWLSDIHGTVLNTHIFKDQVSNGIREITLLRPGRNTAPNMELQFGRLYMYLERQLVTFNQSTLFILDPALNKVVASQNRLGGIVDAAVVGDEIFVLRRHTDDMVIRIAENPEKIIHSASAVDFPLPSAALADPHGAHAPTLAPGAGQGPKQTEWASSPKSFLKKKLFTPFKKLDSLLHEHSKPIKDPVQQSQPMISAKPRPADLPAAKTDADCGDHGCLGCAEVTSPDLPPVVPLTSPDFGVHLFTGGEGPASPVDIQSPDSAHSALSAFADEMTDSRQGDAQGTVKIQVTAPDRTETHPQTDHEHLGPVVERLHLSPATATANDDIVFSHHGGKKKHKKKKLQGKCIEKDGDNISQSSFSSQVSEDARPESLELNKNEQTLTGDGEGGSDALQRADEALSIVDKILKGCSIPQEQTAGERLSSKPPKTASVRESLSLTESAQTVLVTAGLPANSTASCLREKSETMLVADAAISQTMREETSVSVSENRPAIPTIKDVDSAAVVNDMSSDVKAGKEQSAKPAKQTLMEPVQTGEDQLAAAEKALLAMRKGGRLSRVDSSDDFYTQFSPPNSPPDVFEAPAFASKSVHQNPVPEADRQLSVSSAESDRSMVEATVHRLANSWSEFTTPANIYSLALSHTHIWFTDKSENLYYSTLGGAKGIVWRKVGEPANQISVSPSGHIVWRLHRGRVYVGTKITQKHPEGLHWVEAVKDTSQISVDDKCAWYVKTKGEVMMQRDLSKERPCFRSVSVPCSMPVKKVMARYGVVWAITESLKLLVRVGITADVPQGLEWQEINRHVEPFLFSSCSIDNEGIGWAVDVVGQIWFTDHITARHPAGSGHWWQVPLSEYYVQDSSLMDTIRSIAKKFDPQKLTYVMSTRRGGLIVAGEQGVWLAMDYQNTLHVCRGSLQGYHWSPAQPVQMAEAITWKQVQASITDLDWGLLWAQQVNGELYVIPPDSSDATLVSSPLFVSMAVNEHSVWGLTDNAEVHVRTGMGPHCPHGAAWVPLDLTQLGDVLLVHLSCNSSFVWAVDSDGQVFNRIGAKAPKPGQLNPVWLPIDTYSEIVFTKVVNSPLDWMVWAVDNRRLTYVRAGVTEEMPIGREWVHVPGIQAMDMTLSDTGVWALSTNGEVFFRYGITKENVSGNYWKKIPGSFLKISASASDVLWAINTSGQLVKCSARFVDRRQDPSDPLQRAISSTGSEEGDWELV